MLSADGTVASWNAFPWDSERLLDPTRGARLLAGLRGQKLDHLLAAGADPGGSEQLAARARRLTSRATRGKTAAGLERMMREQSSRRRVLPRGAAIRANAPRLQELAALLRGSTPLYAQGIAMLRALLTDGTGPAYTDSRGDVLARGLERARASMVG
jgi:hypothetical protein